MKRLRHPLCLIAWLSFTLSIPAQGQGIDEVEDRLEPRAAYEAGYAAAAITDVFAVLDGGRNREASIQQHVEASFSFTPASLSGLTLHAYGFGHVGQSASADIGDAQTASNIEAADQASLLEAWAQQNALDGRLSVLLGVYDVNTEFDVAETGALFVNSSFGMGAAFGAAGWAGPSTFPETRPGMRLKIKPRATAYLQTAVVDGARDFSIEDTFQETFLIAAEVGRIWPPEGTGSRSVRIGRPRRADRYDHKIAVGLWYHTDEFPDGAGATDAVGPALYFLGDAVLARDESGRRALTGYIRLGIAPDAASLFDRYAGGALVVEGPFGRHADRIGLGFAGARATSRTARAGAWENVWELTYRLRLSDRIALQPDVQVVQNPAADPAADTAVVGALRVALGL